eukprot:CAMPEP_0183737530 /NCGR_PEP_ID=MMETSP0737-20130205/52255_1 /TAXON_ID=385413 /ORGANISM="Thalassiosira miniscula, Strain CCMP1093" /LENGTH=386 /DNA_ID=CAMNT_0025971831 /DNA_START=126 /DNA_END=1286 /DNA_ORIENTATION=-
MAAMALLLGLILLCTSQNPFLQNQKHSDEVASRHPQDDSIQNLDNRRNLLRVVNTINADDDTRQLQEQATGIVAVDEKYTPPQLELHVDTDAFSAPTPNTFTAKFQKLYPLRYTASSDEHCIKPETVVGLSAALRKMYVNSGIRVFPRNGFLLGIIRHGGFLPNEQVDADLSVIYDDIARVVPPSKDTGEGPIRFHHGGFAWKLNPTDTMWVNWKGLNPTTGEPYRFFGMNIHMQEFPMHANAVYSYRDTGRYFYPRLDIDGLNHEAHVIDSLRYNEQGADYRLVDTDERLDANNFQPGAQIGTYFDTTFDCMMDWQFYFTTILVPCDYDIILTALYGKNWNHVENRGEIGEVKEGKEVKFASHVVSDEENEQLLRAGPKPLCVEK